MEDGDGQTSRRDPPLTPTGDSCALLQLTPSSVSPHPLSAPPPSPVPLLGMPMLLRSWEEEAVQDDNAAVVSSPTDAQPAEEAAPTAQQGAVDVGDSAISVPMEAGQPSSSSAVDGSAAVPSLLLALTAHRDRVQEGASSAGKSVEAVASASPPPPPPPPSVQASARQSGRFLRARRQGAGQEEAPDAGRTQGRRHEPGHGRRAGRDDQEDMGEVARFLEHVERQLVCLTDETQASSCSSHRRARSPEAS
jgi:hypothetical protein